jgi:hypothetical protein
MAAAKETTGPAHNPVEANVAAAPAAPAEHAHTMATLKVAVVALCVAFGLLLWWVLDTDPSEPPRWQDSNDSVLLVHILCMGLAVMLISAAILSWHLAIEPHITRKMIHFGLNAAALVGLVVGLTAAVAWNGHAATGHFFSAHSWIGIIAFCFFAFQAVGGILTFLLPFAAAETRAAALPGHRMFGGLIYIALLLAVWTGIMNREGMLLYSRQVTEWKGDFTYAANFFGLVVYILGGTVLYAVLHRRFAVEVAK